MNRKNIIINSSLIFVIASILEMTLHEFGHFFASILVHAKQISIHHNYVNGIIEGLSNGAIIFVKGSGPLVSLFIGILFHFICSRQKKRNLLSLFNVYMSGFGYIGIFGYMLIAPFFNAGDTGYICYILGFPAWLRIIVAVVGLIAGYFSISSLMKYFVLMGSEDIINDGKSRNLFVSLILIYPLFIGILITTLLNLPVPGFVSLLAAVCSPFTFLWGLGSAFTKKYNLESANKEFDYLNKLHIAPTIYFLLIVIANRLLVYGIYWN